MLTLPAGQREQLVRTLELGLEFPHTAVGRLLGIHRNTVTHRISKGFGLLGLDRGQVLNRVVVSTALQVVVKYGHDAHSADPGADFSAMVSAPEVRAWADSFLEPLRADRRDLLRTLRVWLENDTHTGRTAAALDLAPVTVRSHLRAAAPLIQRDLPVGPDETEALDGNEHEQALSGVRPLAFALHAVHRPPLPAARLSPPLTGGGLCTGEGVRPSSCAPQRLLSAPAARPAARLCTGDVARRDSAS
nr:helix-turn-helix domain-containing protein [Streptomyces sp. S1D4-11]QIY94069.1 hypothetical protein HEP87_08435 [Streptomyces sp. S1D4-11]